MNKAIDKRKVQWYYYIVLNNVEQMKGDVNLYDYSKLNGKIVEKCGTQAIFASKMGLSERTISLKLNNKIDWRQSEILKAVKILNIPIGDIEQYFFTLNTQYN